MSDDTNERIRILFVCTGNICRSPTAEGVVRRMAEDDALAGRLILDSAGTGGWHVGDAPDPRAVAAARQRGYDLSGIRARQVSARDFEAFDLIVAMDRSHRDRLLAIAPDDAAEKVRLFLEFADDAPGTLDVPDPYYGADNGFETVLDLIEAGSRGLLRTLDRSRGSS